jgi:hypothetical protein
MHMKSLFNSLLVLLVLSPLSNSLYSDNYTRVSNAEKNNVVKVFNNARSAVGASNMNMVSWNNTCEKVLENIADKYGKNWFFEPSVFNESRLPGMPQRNAFNIEFLHLLPEFNETCPGYRYLERDTYKNAKNPMSFIFRFRQAQKRCCQMNNCDSKIFTNYQTCCTSNVKSSRPCSSAFHYYPRHYISSLDQLSGIILNRRGPFTPDPRKQRYVYFIYGRFEHKTDMPYKKITKNEKNETIKDSRCFECPLGKTKCIDGLCAD